MPIPVLAPLVPEPEPVVLAQGKRSYITWEVSGQVIPLTGDISGNNTGVIVQPGIKGFDAPPVELMLEEVPSYDGAMYRHQRRTARELFLPLFIWAPTRHELVTFKRSLIRSFHLGYDSTMGLGRLRVTEYDADGEPSSRYIEAYYAGGFEGDEGEAGQFCWSKFGLTLQCPDPFWTEDANDLISIEMYGSNPINFFTGKERGDPDELDGTFFGEGTIHLSKRSETPADGWLFYNKGDVEAWPIWTIRAENANKVHLKNLTTGKQLSVQYTFPHMFDYVRIDTRPGRKTITDSGGGNLFAKAGNNPQLWSLVQGENRVEVTLEASGLDPITATVECEYNPRYWGA